MMGDDAEPTVEQQMDEGEISSSEEAFMKGYEDQDEVEECAECGGAIDPDKKLVKEFDEEVHKFCSPECAQEFEEGLGK